MGQDEVKKVREMKCLEVKRFITNPKGSMTSRTVKFSAQIGSKICCLRW